MTAQTADLSSCDAEPIQIPGSIQPHGYLLAFDEPEGIVSEVSENVGALLGAPARTVLGRPLDDVLGPAVRGQVAAGLGPGAAEPSAHGNRGAFL